MANVPSQHTSQITFKKEDEVYHVPDTPPQPSKTSFKGKSSSSKSSLKSGSKQKSGKSLDKVPATSTPKSSRHKSLDDLELSNISAIQAESGDYAPMIYIFRSPNANFVKEVKVVPTKCPPYAVQLDHTLAVIWILFSPAEARKPLGIVQLQWAHTFLQGIYNRKGEHPKDVALCLQTIEDELIEQYAEMVDDVEYIKRPEGGEITPETREKSKSKVKSKSKSKKPQGSRSEGEVPDMEGEEEEIEINSEVDKDSEKASYTDSCPNRICTDQKDAMTTKRVPFSINYADMMNRSPPDVEQLYPGGGRGSRTSSQYTGTRKSTSAVGTSVSRDNMMEFLKAWRREQVEKIQSELKRLKSIETFIGSAETENFSPYLDDQQLDTLVAQRMAGSTDNKSKSRHKGKS